jgi:hypothetical protein
MFARITKCKSKEPANNRKKIKSEDSSFTDRGLDGQERTTGKDELIHLASIFGGASTY